MDNEVRNQLSIPSYEKPSMEVISLEIEGVLASSGDNTDVGVTSPSDKPTNGVGGTGQGGWGTGLDDWD